MKWHRPIPYSGPFLNFFYSNQWGKWALFKFLLFQSMGNMGPFDLSYASDSGAAKIGQQGAKVRVWEGGFPLPR